MRFQTRTAPIVGCDGCGEVKVRRKFGDEMLEDWSSSLIKEVYCKDCCGENPKRAEAARLQCYGLCKTSWPEYHFDNATLVASAADDNVLSRQCARCIATAKHGSSTDTHSCARCKAWKPISDFGPVACKEWLSENRTGGPNKFRWVCFDCGYPPCVLCDTENRPKFAVPHNALVDGQYYCFAHRYPPCIGCGKSRENPGTNHRFQAYTCDDCRGNLTCHKCEIPCASRNGATGEFVYCRRVVFHSVMRLAAPNRGHMQRIKPNTDSIR